MFAVLLLATVLVIVPVETLVVPNPDALFTVDSMHLPIPRKRVISLPVEARRGHPLPPQEVRELIGKYFQPRDEAWALRVSYCESRWDANAKNDYSTAAGLFQFLRGTWNWVASKLSLPSYASGAPYDPEMNVQAAAWLFYNGGPSHWECK